jgi:hypothetical protein
VWSILVGGTKLSRGYTVEGLTTSYYRRTANASDTLMQMGRWFGYRRNYKDLVRLFIGREEQVSKTQRLDLYEAFRAMCLDEEEFRSDLRKYASMEDPRITPAMIPPLVPSHLLRPTAANKMYNATVASQNFGGAWCEKTNAPTKPAQVRENSEAMSALLRSADVTEVDLAVTVRKKHLSFSALVSRLDPDDVVNFLAGYKWSGTNPHLLARYLDFLRGKHGNTEIESWLFIAPQMKQAGVAVWRSNDHSFAVRHRARVTPEGDRYKVYTDPVHRHVSEYLCGVDSGEKASKRTEAFRSATQAVFLFYPVRDTEAKKPEETSMGFALLFPKNKIKSSMRFTVHDQKRASAITVARK